MMSFRLPVLTVSLILVWPFSVMAEQFLCETEAITKNWKGQGSDTYLRKSTWTLASDGFKQHIYNIDIADDGLSGTIETTAHDMDRVSDDEISFLTTDSVKVFTIGTDTHTITKSQDGYTFSVVGFENTGFVAFGSCKRLG